MLSGFRTASHLRSSTLTQNLMLVIHASTLPMYPPNNKMDANQFPYTGLSQTMTPASGFTLAGTKRKDNNAASTLTYNQPAGS
uniref:Uncharacterized protein n=1 Tax=Brassica oleracea var. oleracea TaxID=109376 RepID=A0A0D3B5P4_BRAOL